MIKYTVGPIATIVDYKVFKGGEVNVNINCGSNEPDIDVDFVIVDARLQSGDDLLALIHATYALRAQYPVARFALSLPYVPYGRQDRVCNPGESLGIRVFADQLNALKYDIVETFDPHSVATGAVINNLIINDQFSIFGKVMNFAETIIIAPDLGALKKCEDFAKRVGAKVVIGCHKERNLATTEIVRQFMIGSHDLKDKHVVVVDDLIDGGRTFVGVHEMLNAEGASRIDLIVTHGIFSYGVDVVTELYDNVYTTNSFRDDLSGVRSNLKVMNVG